ncbi:MAG TPA: alanine racemase, partial [Savagea sp.]
MFRNTKAVINLAAIGYNIRKLQQLLPEGRKMMGVVKADGYGHGSVAVARKLIEANVDYLMVALLEEAMHLRENGIDIPILVVGRVHPEDAKIAAEQGITLNVYEAEWIKAVNNMNLTTPLSIHIEFETGMNRTGVVSKEALASLVKEVKRNP